MTNLAHQLIAFTAIVLLSGGCAAARPRRGALPSTRAAASTLPVTLSLADAIPIEKLRTPETDVDLRNVIHMPDGDGDGKGAGAGDGQKSDLYFGQLDALDDTGQTLATAPILAARVKGHWLALNLSDPRLPDAEFLYVAAGAAKNEIWALLDDQLHKNPAPILLLAHSTDAGKSWTLTPFAKPRNRGSYDSFAMDKSGHGRLTIYLTRRDAPRRSGFYHFHTTSAGQSWSAPDYEPDSLSGADDVPPDEDPPPLTESPKTTVSELSAHSHLVKMVP